MIFIFLRIFMSACFILALAACGFQPLYGTQSAKTVTAQFDRIKIANIPDREGQILRNLLIDRLYQNGVPTDPAYTLSFDPVKERITDLDITKSADATRAQLRLDTTMKLSDQAGTVLLERPLMAITSYNKLQSHFTTRVSENAARESALGELARKAETQLALYFERVP